MRGDASVSSRATVWSELVETAGPPREQHNATVTRPARRRGRHPPGRTAGRRYILSCTARMFPAGSVNQAIVGPWPREMPFSSWSNPS
jgi:hypothetical protein